jgi:hypothetical protein
MTTSHDDLPHPVPPLAFLRWKENYFFIVIDPLREAFGVAHFNFEPGFDRARLSCNFNVRGKPYKYGNQTPFPERFEMARELGDEHLRLAIDESHTRFRLDFSSQPVEFNLVFEKRLPSFDFNACRYAAPELPSFKELMTLGTNLPFEHLQQAMRVTGSMRSRVDSFELAIDGYGYRDHSWCMRSDNLVSHHTWSGLNFRECAFGVMTIETLARPGVIGKEGYVADADGVRALRGIEVLEIGTGPDGCADRVVHELRDVFGRTYTIESSLSERLAHVPLAAEAPNGRVVYEITENFCRSRLLESGEEGYSLVETGRSGIRQGEPR